MTPYARAAALHGYIPTAESLGLDPYAMLKRADLSPQLLDDPEQPIPLSALDALFEQSAHESGHENFGLMMCEARTFGSLGPLAVLLAHATSCRTALAHMVRFQRMIGQAAMYSLEQEGDVYVFRTELQSGLVGRQLREYQMALLCRILRDWLHLPWAPESANFVHAAPGDLRMHARIFRCPLQFESPLNGFVCTPACLDEARSGGDPELADQAFRMVDMLLAQRADVSIDGKVRRAIRLMLPTGVATLEQVAKTMNMSPRTMQRALDDQGQSFRQLLNEVRSGIATAYLADPGRSIADAAQATGFATPTAFTRWFRDRFGQPPSAWRSGAASGGLATGDSNGTAHPAVRGEPPFPVVR